MTVLLRALGMIVVILMPGLGRAECALDPDASFRGDTKIVSIEWETCRCLGKDKKIRDTKVKSTTVCRVELASDGSKEFSGGKTRVGHSKNHALCKLKAGEMVTVTTQSICEDVGAGPEDLPECGRKLDPQTCNPILRPNETRSLASTASVQNDAGAAAIFKKKRSVRMNGNPFGGGLWFSRQTKCELEKPQPPVTPKLGK